MEYRDAFPDLSMSFDEQVADGDRVVTRWAAGGTHQGALQGIPATGRSARISGIFIHRGGEQQNRLTPGPASAPRKPRTAPARPRPCARPSVPDPRSGAAPARRPAG